MPLFIMSMSWTEKGIQTIRDWPKRMKDARSYAKEVGVKIKDVYLTTGDYDLIAIIEAPSADNIARFALGVGDTAMCAPRPRRPGPNPNSQSS